MSSQPRPAVRPLALVIVLVAASSQARQGAPPVTGGVRDPGLRGVHELVLPPIDPQALLAEDAVVAAQGPAPLRFASPLDITTTLDTDGTWTELADGRRAWRLRVHAPGATDLNFGFTRFDLPEEATLHVVAEETGYFVGPYTSADEGAHGQLWTPVVPGDRAVIELVVPGKTKAKTVLELGRVGRGYRSIFGAAFGFDRPKSGACNNDVVCAVGDPWRDEINSVAVYSFGGALSCTGTMIMDVPRTFRPWFLTAQHCGVTAGSAPSIVVYWNFQASACRGARDGSFAQNQSGATWYASSADSDFSLVELDAEPDPAFGVYYSGWDASDARPAGCVAIHHPSTDEKAISFNDDVLTYRSSCNNGAPDTHWTVDNWEDGTTERGSSGSGIWDPDTHLLVGTLTGGGAACGNSLSDCYGRFGVQWDRGTRADRRLRDWLDPGGTGTTMVPGSYPGGASLDYVSHSGLDFCSFGAGGANGRWEPGEDVQVSVVVTSGSALTDVRGTLTTSTPGVTVLDADARWPDLPGGTDVSTLPPHFRIRIDDAFACPSTIDFEVEVTTATEGPFTLSFSETVGTPLVPADVPAAIPDEGSVESSLTIPTSTALTDVNVRVVAEHSWVGDVELRLRAPSGREVVLLDRPGFPAFPDGCPDEDLDVTFDDASGFDLETWCPGGAPWYVGVASPAEALSALVGEDTAGTWTLTATDSNNMDTGILHGWQLLTTPSVALDCTPCVAPPSLTLVSHAGDDSCALGAGDANGAWEPGEAVEVSVVLRASSDLTGVTGTLTTTTPGVTVVDAVAAWPDLVGGVNTRSIAPHFTLSLAPDITCGTVIDLDLSVDATGAGPFLLDLSDEVGRPGQCEACAVAPCPGAVFADTELRVTKGAAGSVVLTFPPPPSACAEGVQVRMGASARPVTLPGAFPTDPAFADVSGSDLDPSSAFRHVPPSGNQHYLVVERLPGDLPGPSGHYGR